MRAGLSTILQTLTPEAATVLNHSIAEAGRRNHNQTTPLHVAATLLAAPTRFLRQACIRSHPNSSHPLQCRALELCFSVALERLPAISTTSPAAAEPPVSNALMAALKRAQAHQRRGCPEQQQQPLLAVKVELEHLIISILDDPSVSRVMREASFSSPAVKATIEQSLNNTAGFRPSPSPANQVPIPINRNLYVNQRLLQQKQGNLNLIDDVRRVIEIMSRPKKKNPILVGEFEPESIKKEFLMSIQKGEQEEFENVEVISIEFPPKINKLVDTGAPNVVINLGDLKWLVEQPPTAVGRRESVADVAKLVTKFGMENRNVWLIGSATWETYLRCQVYHPSMENDWDLQPLPVSSRSPLSSRFGTNGIFGSSVECSNSFTNSALMPPCCPKCFHGYELELARSNELEKSSIDAQRNLPQWLRDAKAQNGETKTETETGSDAKTPHGSRGVNDHELQKKWSDICLRIHLNYHNQTPSFARMITGFAPVVLVPTVMTHKPNRILSPSQSSQQPEAPRSPVRTELILGPKEDSVVKDLLGCISSEPQAKGKFVNLPDSDTFKKLLRGLMKKAWWQPEAASTIATTLAQSGSKGSVWLLFVGPDRVGKKKMASVLADHFCGGDPITICLGSRRDDDETDAGFRGKPVLDRIVEVVRRNPFSVILLLDVDEADMLVRGSIKRAMERGRLTDSYGREISLGNSIFVLTGNWSTNHVDETFDEKRLYSVATGGSQLKLTVCEKRLKRQANGLPEGNISTKQQKKVGLDLSLDLNLGMDVEEDRTDTSDLTIEQGDENQICASTSVSVPHEFVGPSDGLVVFKPVQFELIRREIEKTVKNTFSTIVDEKLTVEVDEQVVDNVFSGLWFGRTGLEDWAEQVLVPSFHKLVGQLPSSLVDLVVCLEYDRDLEANHSRDRLPSKLNVKIDAF